jgi:hypothetical protein
MNVALRHRVADAQRLVQERPAADEAFQRIVAEQHAVDQAR